MYEKHFINCIFPQQRPCYIEIKIQKCMLVIVDRRSCLCPLNNQCMTPRIVYKAEVTNDKNQEKKVYIGLTETTFKELHQIFQQQKIFKGNRTAEIHLSLTLVLPGYRYVHSLTGGDNPPPPPPPPTLSWRVIVLWPSNLAW